MTHIENVPHILQHGITHLSSPNVNKNYTAIGDNSLISRRNNFPLENGKMLGDYIPFYFGVCMPMLYVIQKGYNSVKAIQPQDIVYCISSVEQIIKHNLDYIYTDGHAVESFSTFFDPHSIQNIEQHIDETAIGSQYWKDENDLDKKRRKEAEFLVASDIPQTAILGFAVYNNAARDILLQYGLESKRVAVRNHYYF